MAPDDSPSASVDQFYVLKQGGMHGPFTREELHARYSTGILAMEDFVQMEGVPIWQPLARVLGSDETIPHGAIAPDWKSLIRWAWLRLRYDIDEQSAVAGLVCLGVGLAVLALSHWTFLFWLPWVFAALLSAVALIQRRRTVAGILLLLGVILLPLGVFIWHAKLRAAPALPFQSSTVESSPELQQPIGLTTAKATPEQEKAFIDAFKKASETKDEKTLLSFLYSKGGTPEVGEGFIAMLKMGMGAKIKSIELRSLTPEDVAMVSRVLVPDGLKVSKKLIVETADGGDGSVEIMVAEKDGSFVIPVPSGLSPEAIESDNSPPSQASWKHDGATPKVVTVRAESGELLSRPGVKVRFFDQEVPPGFSESEKNSVQVFFPKSGTGYGKPISITFTSAKGSSGQVQEGNLNGYNGQLTSADGKVSGWVRINGVGPESESSFAAKFEAALPSQ